jgi:hypothetical protein
MSKIKDVVIDDMNLDREIIAAAKEWIYRHDTLSISDIMNSFIAGANYMKGKMYSDSEVITLLTRIIDNYTDNNELSSEGIARNFFYNNNKKPQ